MTLFEKIKTIYPEFSENDLVPMGNVIIQNDSDGNGDYIAVWNHPTLAEPTAEQLA
jgi:hypothetical protein